MCGDKRVMKKLQLLSRDFGNAVNRLKEVLDLPQNDVVRDSAIQRFEFCFDLAWKVIKAYLDESCGIMCASPKSCFRAAFRQKLIDFDDAWIEMTDLRNKTVHMYNEQIANQAYQQLPSFLQLFEMLQKNINKSI